MGGYGFAMSDADLADVTFTRIYDAPIELVFAALTTPAHMTNHFGPPGITAPLESILVEPHVGGRFNLVMVHEESGQQFPNTGTITVWDPPYAYAASEPGETVEMENRTSLRDLGDGRTEVVTVQTNMPAMYRTPEAAAGMNAWFDRFAGYLTTIR
jgi:uncharacterized protein YndB with AHSA1/START domain